MLVPELVYAESADQTEVACAVSLVPTFEPVAPQDFFQESVDQKPKATKFSEGSDFEFYFLVDRSGSMGFGSGRIEMAVEALKLFICSLPEGCNFNIISFGSRWDRLSGADAFLTFDQDTKERVLGQISRFDADYGGTDILSPLQNVLTKFNEGKKRRVFLLTDGQAAKSKLIIEEARRHNE